MTDIPDKTAILGTVLKDCPDVIWLADRELRIRFVTRSVEAQFGYRAEDLVGNSLARYVSKHSREFISARVKSRMADEDSGIKTGDSLVEIQIVGRNGGLIHAEVSVSPLRNAEGMITGYHGVARNVSDRVRIDEHLRKSERNYRELVERTNSFVIRWTTTGVITFANTHTCEFFGFLPEELSGRHLVGTIVPETESTGQNLNELIAQIGENPAHFRSVEHENMRWDGSRVWIAWANAPSYDSRGNLVEILSVGHDVSERRQREQQLAYLTVYDPMTGLYNRAYFDTELDRLSKGRKFPVTIVIASLDDLQSINDNEGRDAGDLLLMKTTTLLKEGFRVEDLVARTGGDGFAMIFPGLDENQTTDALVRFRQELAEASAEEPAVVMSLGAATARSGAEIQRAQREASAAMAAEKNLHRKKAEQRDRNMAEREGNACQ